MLRLKQIILTVMVVTLLSAFVYASGPQRVHAQASDVNCDSGCYSWIAWNGLNYGGSARLEMTGSLSFNNGVAFFQKWAGFWAQEQGADGKGAIHVGEEVSQGHDGVCGLNSSTKHVYFLIQAFNANNASINTSCTIMDSANYNEYSGVQVDPYTSNGGGMLVRIFGYDGQTINDFIPYGSGIEHSFQSMGMQEEIFDTVKGHEVWGAYNEDWAYYNGSKYILQDRLADILYQDNPPQMYWVSGYNPLYYPGGRGITCDYDTGQSCTHGS